MRKVQGFTLIELMVVIAIIGLIASIAIPAYRTYQARSKVIAAVAEISSLKAPFQILLESGQDISDVSELGSNTSTANCSTISAEGSTATGAGSIVCTITNAPPEVEGKTITMTRNITPSWACTASVSAELTPPSCPGI